MARGWQGWQWFAVSSMACGLLACPHKGGTADGGLEDGAVASAVVEAGPPPLAANESAVTRYPDETPVNHLPLKTRWATSTARTQGSASGGDVVAVLKAGTEVEKIADRQSFYLVLFTDPSEPSRTEMGWVGEGVFGSEPMRKRISEPATVDAGGSPSPSAPPISPKKLDEKRSGGKCAPGYASCGAICRLQCGKDADCGTPGAHCQGGFCLGPGAKPCGK
jgi:hypothetical protein